MFLPPELYRPIVQNVDRRADLYRLLFVSRIISNEAERALYREIHLERYVTTESIELFLHLTNCQRVARYVQELQILGLFITCQTDQYWSSMNQALGALSHLRVLVLSTWSNPDPDIRNIPSSIFANCSFRLEVLKLKNYASREFPPIDLTQVKELALRNGDLPVLTSHPNAFLSLRVLTLSLPQFLELGIRNTSRVKALEFMDATGLRDGPFASITSLKLYTSKVDLRAFSSLRYLFCYDQYLNETVNALLESLATLKHVQKICFMTGPSQYSSSLRTRVFASISSLQEFVYVYDGYNVLPNGRTAQLWHRNGGEPAHVQLHNFVIDEWKDCRWF